MAPQSRNEPMFQQGESCLCFHGPVLYQSKVLNVARQDEKDRKSPWQYEVHYQGWKKSWDEWLTDDRMRKDTPENRELMRGQHQSQKLAQKQQTENKKDSKKASKSEASSKRKSKVADDLSSSVRASEERGSSVQASAPPRGLKRHRDWEMEKEQDFLSKPAIRIPIPDLLKSILVDDWEWVTKDTKLVPVPHAHPVSEILAEYRQAEVSKRREGSAEADVLDEIVQGVREYFDKSLGRILLYRFERQQWHEILTATNKDPTDPTAVKTVTTPATEDGRAEETTSMNVAGKLPSEIYGAEHLCRLFVSMPELIAQTNMDHQSVNKLKEELTKLTSWLGKNWRKYEAKAYYDPGDDYRDKARGMN